jgi:hypothetical protein
MANEKSAALKKKPYAVKAERSRFDPAGEKPYRVSRSGIDRFLECPRCFYLEKRLGIARPDAPGFPINSAIDELLKREFDAYRAKGKAHPLLKQYGIDAVPYRHCRCLRWTAIRRDAIIITSVAGTEKVHHAFAKAMRYL